MTDATAVGTIIASLGFVGGVLVRGLPFLRGKSTSDAVLREIASSVAGLPEFIEDHRKFVLATVRQLDEMSRNIMDNGKEIERTQAALQDHDRWERWLYERRGRPDVPPPDHLGD